MNWLLIIVWTTAIGPQVTTQNGLTEAQCRAAAAELAAPGLAEARCIGSDGEILQSGLPS